MKFGNSEVNLQTLTFTIKPDSIIKFVKGVRANRVDLYLYFIFVEDKQIPHIHEGTYKSYSREVESFLEE